MIAFAALGFRLSPLTRKNRSSRYGIGAPDTFPYHVHRDPGIRYLDKSPIAILAMIIHRRSPQIAGSGDLGSLVLTPLARNLNNQVERLFAGARHPHKEIGVILLFLTRQRVWEW